MEYCGDGEKSRKAEWTDSIVVGSKPFVEKVKALLGFRAIGRDVIQGAEGYQIREEAASYKAHFGAEKGNIGIRNTSFWDINVK